MATLSINNVKKSFGKVEVIHGVSVDVNDGVSKIMRCIRTCLSGVIWPMV